MTAETIEFDWLVLKIINEPERRGAQVRYMPLAEGCTECEQFVPIPWHKCRDIDHAKQVMEQKIMARAPRSMWMRELEPPPADNSARITGELDATRLTGTHRAEPEGSGNGDRLSESGETQGRGE